MTDFTKLSNLENAKIFAQQSLSQYHVDLSKLDGSETTTFQVAEKVLSKDDLIDWFEKALENYKPGWRKYNPSKYDEFVAEGENKLKELGGK